MSYITSFSIENMEDIVLPFDFFSEVNVDEEKLNSLKKIKKDLKSLGDEITKKQQKQLKSIKKEIKSLKNGSTKLYTNKYGFQCLHCEYKDIEKQILEDEEKVFFLSGNNVYSLSEEGEFIVFVKKDNGYILHDIGYTKSNYGWVEEKFIDLIKSLKLSAIILDEGDEEHGYRNEDGMTRAPINKVFVNGVQQ